MYNHFESRLEGNDLQVQEYTFKGWVSYKIYSKANNQTLLFIPDLNISVSFDPTLWGVINSLEINKTVK